MIDDPVLTRLARANPEPHPQAAGSDAQLLAMILAAPATGTPPRRSPARAAPTGPRPPRRQPGLSGSWSGCSRHRRRPR
jgi:hypothetical protein